MKLLLFLLQRSLTTLSHATLAGLVTGVCSAALIAVVNSALHRGDWPSAILVGSFAGLVIAKLGSGAYMSVLLTRFSQEATSELRRELSFKILATPLSRLEMIGIAQLLAVLTEDVQVIRSSLQYIPTLAVNVAILAACTLYLAYLSWPLLVVVLAFVTLGVAVYPALARMGLASLGAARGEHDNLLRLLRALTEGVKELKLHRARREAFMAEALLPTTELLKRHHVKAMTYFVLAQSWGYLLYFALLAVVLFALPSLLEIDTPTLTGYVLTILYLLAPLGSVARVLPALAPANVALQKIEATGLSLATRESRGPDEEDRADMRPWASLELIGVSYAYPHEQGDRDFTLGPLNLRLRPGEIVFLSGGNGSGKSTLAKLLVGLYLPDTGEVRHNGRVIGETDLLWYRELFSVVFSDGYLFDNLLGLGSSEIDALARDHLALLQLDGKVKVENGEFSTTALSRGERKRLALLTAYLEDRPIYVFDEWAADQDPQFKELYYKHLLPALRDRGKTVLAITHDERYFDVADRVIRLEEGQLEP